MTGTPMVTVAHRREEADRWTMLRARQLVDTAMRRQRIISGLSAASPEPRGFVRAGVFSLLLWAVILGTILSL